MANCKSCANCEQAMSGKARNVESGIHQDHEIADRARGVEGGGVKRMHAQGMGLTETEGKAAWVKHTI